MCQEFNGSPLHTAAKYGKDTIALILIAASADIDAVDKVRSRHTLPYNYARNEEDTGCSSSKNLSFIPLIYLSNLSCYCVQCKNTALHVATRFDHPKMVASLIGAGADVNVQNEVSVSPMRICGSEYRQQQH